MLRAQLIEQSEGVVCKNSYLEYDPIMWDKLKALGYTDEVQPSMRIRGRPPEPR